MNEMHEIKAWPSGENASAIVQGKVTAIDRTKRPEAASQSVRPAFGPLWMPPASSLSSRENARPFAVPSPSNRRI
jgi:hypothetical protein